MAGDVNLLSFDPIAPAPVRDYFTFDFTSEIAAVTIQSNPVITNATWTCTLSTTVGGVIDPDPGSRIINLPTHDDYKTTALCGDMVDGSIYILDADVTISDGRILSRRAEVACFLEPHAEQPPTQDGNIPFDYDGFITSFPEFEGVSPDALQGLYYRAGLLFENDACNPVCDPPTRAILLNLLTAHLAQMYGGPGGSATGGGMVGRINSKSVNGVSISADGFPGVNGTQGWYLTTKYGIDYWKITAAFRTFRYVPGPTRFPQGGYGWGPFPYYGAGGPYWR